MNTLLARTAGLAFGALAGLLPAYAVDRLTGADGMTLYFFDKDAGGVPACYELCATNWPPYLGKAGAAAKPGWTLVPRKDGALQWAYQGKPLYYFAGDKKAGDETGNGRNGVWHTITD